MPQKNMSIELITRGAKTEDCSDPGERRKLS